MGLLHQYNFLGIQILEATSCKFLNGIRIIPSIVFQALSTALLNLSLTHTERQRQRQRQCQRPMLVYGDTWKWFWD